MSGSEGAPRGILKRPKDSSHEAQQRTLLACDNCRLRKVKCDGRRPICSTCSRRKHRCLWTRALAPGQYTTIDETTLESPGRDDLLSAARPDLALRNSEPPIFPPVAKFAILFEIFFRRHHDVEFCSFLHKPTLNLTRLCSRSPFLAASVATLSALYVSDATANSEFGFRSSSAMSEYYAEHARQYARLHSTEPSVQTILAYLILSLRELIVWSGFKSWLHTGTAIRMAHGMRIGSEYNQRHSPRLKETRRRTFWACFIMDRLVAYCVGGSHAIMLIAVRVQLPCPENVYAFEEPYTGPYLEDVVTRKYSVSQLGLMPFYIAIIRLWGEAALLHTAGGRRWFKKPPTDPNGEFRKIEQAVDDFAELLPSQLQWSYQNYQLHRATRQAQAFVAFHFLLKHASCVLHQEYLPQLDSPSQVAGQSSDFQTNYPEAFDSAGVSLDNYDERIISKCLANANAITDMAMTLYQGSEEDRQILQSVGSANAFLTAASVHLWAQYTQVSEMFSGRSQSKLRADTLLQIIKSWLPEWKVASAWAESLEMLYKLYEIAYGTTDFSQIEAGFDEIANLPLLTEEPEAENGSHPGLTHGDGIPDPSTVFQRLTDKIRTMMLGSMEPSEAKKRKLAFYLHSLQRHMFGFEAMDDTNQYFEDLYDIEDELLK